MAPSSKIEPSHSSAPRKSRKQKPVCLCIGASRGIGRQIAIDVAASGFAVVVAAKTTSDASACEPFPPDPNSSASTINTVVREIVEAGGEGLAVQVDVRNPRSIEALVEETIKHYKRIDCLIYNSGAIWWSSVEKTPLKRYQLMQQVNAEGLYATVQACLPYLYQNGSDSRGKGRIVVVSPPIYSRFMRGKAAYAMTKVACSVLTLGLSMDFIREGRKRMAITSLWPAAAIESAATQKNNAPPEELRTAKVFSDAVLAILKADPAAVNGRLLLDEDFLREHEGITDFSKYALVPGTSPRRIMPAILPDLTVAEQDDEGNRMDSSALRKSKL